jgi:hypothetical protein
MTFTRPKVVALAAAGLLAVTTVPVAGASADEARVAVPPDASRVVARCSGGPGRIAVTVNSRGGGSYRVTVVARRLAHNDALWATDLSAFTRRGEEVLQTFLRRPVDGSWSFRSDVHFEEDGPATFLVDSRSSGARGDTICLVGNSPTRPVGAFSTCGRGFQLLVLRPKADGTLVARHNLFFVAPHRRWQLEFEVESEERGEGSGTTGRTNGNGVLRTETQLGDLADYDDSVFTATAESRRGRHCRIRLDPGTFTEPGAAADRSMRGLLTELIPIGRITEI